VTDGQTDVFDTTYRALHARAFERAIKTLGKEKYNEFNILFKHCSSYRIDYYNFSAIAR